MTDFYISPTGSPAKGMGASWANAASIDQLSTILSKAQAGDSILLRADQGSYNVTKSINLAAGGEDGAPITIKGVDGAGHDMNAIFVSDRAAVYAPTATQGAEVFRLTTGASHLVFENMTFNDVGNAFRLAGNSSDITIKDMAATNVSRFLDNLAAGSSANTATVSDLTISNIDVRGFSKGVIHLDYSTNNVVIDHVNGDGQKVDNGNFAMGIHLDGSVHDVTISNTSIGNIQSTKTGSLYNNGDAFATEANVFNVAFNNTYAYDSTDGGYDIKSSSTVLNNAVAEGNTRNFRLWASDIVANNIVGVDPTYHGGITTSSNIWFGSNGHATINNSNFYQRDKSVTVLDLTNHDTSVILTNFHSDVLDANFAKLSDSSSMTGAPTANTTAAPGRWTVDGLASIMAAAVRAVAEAKAAADEAAADAKVAADAKALLAAAVQHVIGTDTKDTLVGKDGNDFVDGGKGADKMTGGLGDDTYVVDNAGDRVFELSGQGHDGIHTTLARFMLSPNVEQLTFTGTGTFAGTGNEMDNLLTGGVGNDRLDGGFGADRMEGGLGSDTYVVDHVGDVAFELDGQGVDTVLTSLASFTVGEGLENLTYTGTANFIGIGNALDNIVTGGKGNDVLSGMDGNDSIYGGRGQDAISGGTGNDILDGAQNEDVIHGGLGDEHVIGGANNDFLYGDDGHDIIIGDFDTITATNNTFAASDKIEGGAGDDILYGDAITMMALTGGNDQILGGIGNDIIYGDADTLSGTAKGGNDTINGGGGDDNLFGGDGNDLFVFEIGAGKDVIHDFAQVAGNQDKIDFNVANLKYADLKISYVDGGAHVETPNYDTITLLGVTHLSAADFLI